MMEENLGVIKMKGKSKINPLGFGFAMMFFVALIVLASAISFMFDPLQLMLLWMLVFSVMGIMIWVLLGKW